MAGEECKCDTYCECDYTADGLLEAAVSGRDKLWSSGDVAELGELPEGLEGSGDESGRRVS